MSTAGLVFKYEVKQAKLNFALVFALSVLLGASGHLALKAESRIRSLNSHVSWNADLVILPKGVGLEDFHREIIMGKTSEFLPEALFDTTVGLAQGQFKVGAILPITDSSGSRVMLKGERLGLAWLKNEIKLTDWNEQNTYETPEWKNKLIAGFFAEGPPIAMTNLKQLIDKKTVAQAIPIRTQEERDEAFQEQLNLALWTFLGVLLVVSLICFSIIAIWFKSRIDNTLRVLTELGHTDAAVNRLLWSMAMVFIAAPALIGFIATFAYQF